MRRAIETDYDYKDWVGETFLDKRELLFFQDSRNHAELHTTHPKKYWADSSLNPKVQLKSSAEISQEWEKLGRYMSDKEIKTCADWFHYVNTIPSALDSTQDGRANDDSYSITIPVEKIKINVHSDENDFDGDYPYFTRRDRKSVV